MCCSSSCLALSPSLASERPSARVRALLASERALAERHRGRVRARSVARPRPARPTATQCSPNVLAHETSWLRFTPLTSPDPHAPEPRRRSGQPRSARKISTGANPPRRWDLPSTGTGNKPVGFVVAWAVVGPRRTLRGEQQPSARSGTPAPAAASTRNPVMRVRRRRNLQPRRPGPSTPRTVPPAHSSKR